jgi:hypothetical protein
MHASRPPSGNREKRERPGKSGHFCSTPLEIRGTEHLQSRFADAQSRFAHARNGFAVVQSHFSDAQSHAASARRGIADACGRLANAQSGFTRV